MHAASVKKTILFLVTFVVTALRIFMSTPTAQGYITPFEDMFAEPETFSRVWGCKAFTLKPRFDLRKYLGNKAYHASLVGYTEE